MLIKKLICFVAVVTPMFCGAVTQEEAHKAYQSKISALEWQRGPVTGQVSDKASLKLESGLSMLDMQNSDTFLQINGNPPFAARNVIAEEGWFAVFQFEPVGYVQ
jgi:uncharacterized membrane-anchored protein